MYSDLFEKLSMKDEPSAFVLDHSSCMRGVAMQSPQQPVAADLFVVVGVVSLSPSALLVLFHCGHTFISLFFCPSVSFPKTSRRYSDPLDAGFSDPHFASCSSHSSFA